MIVILADGNNSLKSGSLNLKGIQVFRKLNCRLTVNGGDRRETAVLIRRLSLIFQCFSASYSNGSSSFFNAERDFSQHLYINSIKTFYSHRTTATTCNEAYYVQMK